MVNYYIDTNIFYDLVEDRKNIYDKDVSSCSIGLFYKILKNKKHKIILSTWMFKELEKYLDLDFLKAILSLFKKQIIKIKYDSNDQQRARLISESNYPDALHLVLAEKSNVDILITRNISDFKEFKTKIKIKKPEWI